MASRMQNIGFPAGRRLRSTPQRKWLLLFITNNAYDISQFRDALAGISLHLRFHDVFTLLLEDFS